MIEVRNLSFSYRADADGGGEAPRKVIQELDFTVERGDFVAIQGPSGSGKSTLFYILGCMLRPSEGSVLINGQDISRLSDDELAWVRNREIGFVFQQFHLLPRASVLENVLLPTRYPAEHAHPGRDRLAKARALLERLGLAPFAHRRPNQLSGGQQQRVAIARALMNDVELILADEPTGNLDSRTAAQTLELLRELNREGKTVVIITHDPEVARQCRTVYSLRDGVLVHTERRPGAGAVQAGPARWATPAREQRTGRWARVLRAVLPVAFDNLLRNKAKSVLTMLGVVIGIAAVMAMITLGKFTQRKILETYEVLGVNLLSFSGYPNWERKATDPAPVNFTGFDLDRDLEPLRRIFPQVRFISPVLNNWRTLLTAGGITMDENVRLLGANPEALAINNREVILGTGITPAHVENRSPVCLIGTEIVKRLFDEQSPIGQILSVGYSDRVTFPCRVIGVLSHQTSNKDWWQPDYQVWVPYTYFQAASDNWWEAQIHRVAVQLRSGSDIERTGKSIQAYFELKYGKSGKFRLDSDSTLIAQMKRFLTIFTFLLTAIAFLSLIVGGIGINNMMIVSVTERFREFGLRKALGATHRSIRIQVLAESVLLCAAAGLIGAVLGFTAYETMILAATKFVTGLKFEWVWDPVALSVSVVSILAVGLLSGLVPAVRAEKLEVIEALRSE
jgi:macrolide transport system ATP-binding/permease protein